MNTKILLIAFSAVAITSCTTAYKSAQTPDDVYYSPVRVADERREDDTKKYERRETYNPDDSRTRMAIRDRRWRDLNDEYDYSYRYSPYNYSYCNCACNTGYGYYYNPFYYPRPLYQTVIYKPAVNTTPRTVNLNAYKNYNQAVTYNPKQGTITGQSMSNNGGTRQVRQYNNSNSESKVGRVIRQVITPSNSSSNRSSSSSSESNSRTYTPSSSSGSSSSGSSSSGSSSGGSVSRPGRG